MLGVPLTPCSSDLLLVKATFQMLTALTLEFLWFFPKKASSERLALLLRIGLLSDVALHSLVLFRKLVKDLIILNCWIPLQGVEIGSTRKIKSTRIAINGRLLKTWDCLSKFVCLAKRKKKKFVVKILMKISPCRRLYGQKTRFWYHCQGGEGRKRSWCYCKGRRQKSDSKRDSSKRTGWPIGYRAFRIVK